MPPGVYAHSKRPKTDAEIVARFWSKVERVPFTTCWLWNGTMNPDGYGFFNVAQRKMVRAHRFAYKLMVGPIPGGLQLDHLCRERSCVNPAHLEPVTTGENTRRGVGRTATNARKTACKRGHPFTPENTYLSGGLRECRICKHDYDERRIDRRHGVPMRTSATERSR